MISDNKYRDELTELLKLRDVEHKIPNLEEKIMQAWMRFFENEKNEYL